jgi:hypothetical protein
MDKEAAPKWVLKVLKRTRKRRDADSAVLAKAKSLLTKKSSVDRTLELVGRARQLKTAAPEASLWEASKRTPEGYAIVNKAKVEKAMGRGLKRTLVGAGLLTGAGYLYGKGKGREEEKERQIAETLRAYGYKGADFTPGIAVGAGLAGLALYLASRGGSQGGSRALAKALKSAPKNERKLTRILGKMQDMDPRLGSPDYAKYRRLGAKADVVNAKLEPLGKVPGKHYMDIERTGRGDDQLSKLWAALPGDYKGASLGKQALGVGDIAPASMGPGIPVPIMNNLVAGTKDEAYRALVHTKHMGGPNEWRVAHNIVKSRYKDVARSVKSPPGAPKAKLRGRYATLAAVGTVGGLALAQGLMKGGSLTKEAPLTAEGKEPKIPQKVKDIADAIRRDDPSASDAKAYRIAWATRHGTRSDMKPKTQKKIQKKIPKAEKKRMEKSSSIDKVAVARLVEAYLCGDVPFDPKLASFDKEAFLAQMAVTGAKYGKRVGGAALGAARRGLGMKPAAMAKAQRAGRAISVPTFRQPAVEVPRGMGGMAFGRGY